MTVYVDLLFMLNALINYLLLRGSAVIGGAPIRPFRHILGATLGGIYAVAVVVFPLLQKPLFQLLCAAGMLIVTFGWKRNTLKLGLFFFALSFDRLFHSVSVTPVLSYTSRALTTRFTFSG